MYCSKCGKELPDDAQFCSGCGTQLQAVSGGTEAEANNGKELKEHGQGMSAEEQRKNTELAGKIIGASVSIIIGGIAALWALVTFMNDTSHYFGGYNYQPPLTNHELLVIGMGLGGFAQFCVGGIALMVFSQKKPGSVTQGTPKEHKQVHRSLKYAICPQCGKVQGADRILCCKCGAELKK